MIALALISAAFVLIACGLTGRRREARIVAALHAHVCPDCRERRLNAGIAAFESRGRSANR